MKSGRQRRLEIRERRQKKAATTRRTSFAPWLEPDGIPAGTILADQSRLLHDNTYGPRPRFYRDVSFTCRDCGVHEIWTARQQQWWYEVAKGKIASEAARCRDCRRKRRMRRSQERRVHVEGLITKYGIEETAARLQLSPEALTRLRDRWHEA